jgi:hypothetical protein
VSHDSELRATSDLMLRLVDRLRAAEVTKRAESPGTETFARLAWEVTELARTVTRWSELQLRQANEALASAVDTAETDGSPALDTIPARRLDVVLAEWRQAEIRLSQALPGSPEVEAASEAAARLRDEYRTLQDRKLKES